jgi:hypothetical protein
MPTIDISTRNLRLLLMRPDMITENWISWAADPMLMRNINSRSRKISRSDIEIYLLDAMARKHAVIGIFRTSDRRHIGNIEVIFDKNHRNMNLEVLVDVHNARTGEVLTEALPPLLKELGRRFGAEKAVMVVPETNAPLLNYLQTSDWKLEGILRSEVDHATLDRRIEAHYYGKLC